MGGSGQDGRAMVAKCAFCLVGFLRPKNIILTRSYLNWCKLVALLPDGDFLVRCCLTGRPGEWSVTPYLYIRLSHIYYHDAQLTTLMRELGVNKNAVGM